ncbi:MAG: biotin transporter BioY [Gammaproteobacteria bacterium]|nr:MAG: biotin transporter BioY [Gammaproteobacteria bacterium]
MNTRDIVLTALFAAIVAVLGVFPPITVPGLGVPITAQTLGVMLAGGILGAKRGALSLVLFLVLVAVGLPLLAGGRGGLGVFAGPTAGFLFGWVVAAFAIGWMIESFGRELNPVKVFTACILGGIVLLYAIGIPWVAVVAGIPFMQALTGSVAFIPGDILKAVIATGIILSVAKSYPLLPSLSTSTTPQDQDPAQ